jgi:NitT/TauT family transport system substrate-binding protein
MLKRSFRRLVGTALLFAAATLTAAPARAMDKVTVQLDWVVRGAHAMFFVGQQMGFFAQNGIDVTQVIKGSGSANALRFVANGDATFGFADLPTLMNGVANGIPVTAIAAVNQQSPLAMITVKARHVLNTPADLKGLNVGVDPAGGSAYIFLKSFLAANGMTVSDITQSTVAPPYESYLVLGRVDAIPGYVDAEVPELEAKTGGAGSLSVLQGARFGYVALGSGVFTSNKLIATNPDLVRRFVKAYLQSMAFVAAHPDQAVAMIVKANPEYAGKEPVLREELGFDIAHSFFSPTTAAHGIGYISPAQWGATVAMLQKQAGLPASASATGGFDDAFVDAAKPEHR